MKGEKMFAEVDCVEVELVGVDMHGTFMARFVGAEAGLAREKFTANSTIVGKF